MYFSLSTSLNSLNTDFHILRAYEMTFTKTILHRAAWHVYDIYCNQTEIRFYRALQVYVGFCNAYNKLL